MEVKTIVISIVSVVVVALISVLGYVFRDNLFTMAAVTPTAELGTSQQALTVGGGIDDPCTITANKLSDEISKVIEARTSSGCTDDQSVETMASDCSEFNSKINQLKKEQTTIREYALCLTGTSGLIDALIVKAKKDFSEKLDKINKTMNACVLDPSCNIDDKDLNNIQERLQDEYEARVKKLEGDRAALAKVEYIGQSKPEEHPSVKNDTSTKSEAEKAAEDLVAKATPSTGGVSVMTSPTTGSTGTLADILPTAKTPVLAKEAEKTTGTTPIMMDPSAGTTPSTGTLADTLKVAPVAGLCIYGMHSELNKTTNKYECVAYCKSTEEFKGLDETTKKPTCVAKDGGGGVRPDGPYPDDCKADQYVKYNEQTVKYECANYCSTDQVFKGLDATTKKATCVAKTAIDDTKGRTVITCNTGSYAKLNDTTKKYECTAYCATGQEFKGLDATTKKATCVATAPATASGSATASPAKAVAASATASKAATTKTVATTGAPLPLVIFLSVLFISSLGLLLRILRVKRA